jgi:hypothetical protein
MKGMNEAFDEFDLELSRALRRVDAPATLAQSVMAAVEDLREPSGLRILKRVLTFPRRQAWIGSVAASLLLAGLVFGGVEHRRAAERTQAERDFATSLEITNRAMEQTRLHLQRAGIEMD